MMMHMLETRNLQDVHMNMAEATVHHEHSAIATVTKFVTVYNMHRV